MTDRCDEREAVELSDDTVVIRCTLPLGHNEAHRAVIFWPASRDLVSIDEIWEVTA